MNRILYFCPRSFSLQSLFLSILACSLHLIFFFLVDVLYFHVTIFFFYWESFSPYIFLSSVGNSDHYYISLSSFVGSHFCSSSFVTEINWGPKRRCILTMRKSVIIFLMLMRNEPQRNLSFKLSDLRVRELTRVPRIKLFIWFLFLWLEEGICNSWGDCSPDCGPCSIPGQVMWNLRWTKLRLGTTFLVT
jgi:hypothetical protein